MELREFNSIKAKEVSNKIIEKANEVKSLLNAFSDTIDQNIGNRKVWSGDRANNFKQKFDSAEADFSSFINVISSYSSKIDDSAKKHEEYENRY